MNKNIILQPHGECGLINRNVPEVEREHFKEQALKHKVYTISNEDLATFYRIADGTLSPLEGPMNKDEFYSVLEKEVVLRKRKKYAWTIPLAFPISKEESESFEKYFGAIEKEIATSEKLIKKKLNKECTYLAYPYGDTNNLVIALLKKYKYRGAFTVHRGSNPFFMNNYMVNRSTIYGEYSLKRFKKNLKIYAFNKPYNIK